MQKHTHRKVNRQWLWLGEAIAPLFPGLKSSLNQAGMSVGWREYLVSCFGQSVKMGILGTGAFYFLGFALTGAPAKSILIGLVVGLLLFATTLVRLAHRPNLLVKRRIIAIESNLLDALKHLLVMLKAGMTVYDGLRAVANAKYGLVSHEFREAVNAAASGVPIERALEDISNRTPSLYFRRSVWQLSNAMRVGSDVSDVLKGIIVSLSREQNIAMRRYGSQLNPLAMVYLLAAIILPSLGLVAIVVMSSLSGVAISGGVLWMVLAATVLLQFMLMGIIKSKRPAIMAV